MKRFTLPVSFCLLLLSPIAALAGPGSRGTSNNGVDVDAPFWNLYGPTAPVSRDSGQVTLRTQVVCTNQQVASAVDAAAAVGSSTAPFADAGSCTDGFYTYLFQIQSTAKNLEVTISGLTGFTPVSNTTGTSSYGVETCDTPMNTLELCSNVATATTANLTALNKINVTVNSTNTAVSFCIPKVPTFPAGTASQGQGLTLVVLTQQTPGVPVFAPDITIK